MAIFTAIGTALAGALFAGSALAGSLISAGLALAANLALKYLFRPKQRKYSAVQGQVQLGGDIPVSAIYGTAKVKGHRIYYAKWGGGNKYNGEVFVLSNGWCDGLEPEVYFYGEKHVLISQAVTGNEAARYSVTGFGSKISIRFYDGRPSQLADTELVSATATTGNPWKSTSKGAGVCYVVVVREYDSDLFSKGRPEFDFVLRGLREYDPRFDSTVAGGSGAQRLNDASTWVFTKNPSVHRLNYQLGLKGLISGRPLIGVGRDVNQIDLPSHMAAATVCDTTRTVGARTIKTYEASLYAQADDDHIEILAEFEDSMAGYAATMAGLSGVIAGAPQIASATLTVDDIRIDDSLDASYRRSAFESINILSGQFTSPEANWNPVSLKTVTSSGDVAIDGRKRPAANDFLQVSDADIGQYLLNIRYRQNRKAGKASIPVSRRFGAKTSLGDWINWNSKTWLVSGREFDERMRFRLQLSETGSDVYSEAGITAGPVVVAPSTPANPSLISTVAGFSATAGIFAGTDGYEKPTLEFTWTPPSDPTVTQVRFFYRVDGTTDEFEAATSDVEAGVFRTTANVLPELAYEARASITTVPQRTRTFTPWVLTGVTSRESLSVTLADTEDDVRGVISRAIAQIADVRAKLERIAMDAAIGTGKNILRDSAVVRVQNGFAVAMSELSAEVTVIDGIVTATASALTAVEATVDDLSAGGLISFEAQVPPNAGTLATIKVLARASTADAFIASGLLIEVYDDDPGAGVTLKSRVTIIADQFVVTDGTNASSPLVFEGSVLKSLIAKFGNATFDQWSSTNGKLVMKGSGTDASLEIFS